MLSEPELRDALVGAVLHGPSGVAYHLREAIGEGGQGWVFKASRSEPSGEPVVVKVLRPDAVAAEALSRFEREAEVLRRFASGPTASPNIVGFYEQGSLVVGAGDSAVELPFLVLEYVAGRTLAEVISAHGGFGLSLARVHRVMEQVARALEVLHSLKIVHRDLKPSNVMLAVEAGREVAKVTDFGLVKLPEVSRHDTASIAGGTLGYAPPEQYEVGNPRVSPASDVFSFGSVLFEILSGAQAFPHDPADGALSVLARMVQQESPSLARADATVPRELRERPDLTAKLDAALARALSPDPAVRQQDVRELWSEVDAILEAALSRRPLGERRAAPRLSPRELSRELASAVKAPVFRRASRRALDERLRAVSFDAGGDGIFAVGTGACFRFASGAWSRVSLARGVEPSSIRGVFRGERADLYVSGQGFAARLRVDEPTEVEWLPVESSATLVAGAYDRERVVFVGWSSSGHGLLVEVGARAGARGPVAHRLRLVPRPRAVACLEGGLVLVCGEQGALVTVDADGGEREVPWGRTGHLYSAVATSDGGAFVVGSGGHALRVTRPSSVLGPPSSQALPLATLEAVQTTRDLFSVSLDEVENPWAVGANARLLQRRNGTWMRVAVELAGESKLLAARIRAGVITVVAEDGAVFVADHRGTADAAP